MKYEEQYKVIKDLIDHNGNKHRAAKNLGISIRQINRRIKQYQDKVKVSRKKSLFLVNFGLLLKRKILLNQGLLMPRFSRIF